MPTFEDFEEVLIAQDDEINNGDYVNIIMNAFYEKEIGEKGATTSGAIEDDETWSNKVYLEDNINIESFITLTLTSEAKIELNGYKVTTLYEYYPGIVGNYEGIIDDDGFDLDPYIVVYNSSNNIVGIYPSILSALDEISITSGGTYTIKVNDSYIVTDDIIIPSNVTIQLQSNANLSFSPGKYLDIYGNLTANGATFSASSSRWGGIKYNSGSTGSLTNCSIENALYGVRLNSSRTISNCTVTSSGTSMNYGIYINNASPTIQNCEITGTNFSNTTTPSCGIYNYYGDPLIYGNTITATYGIYNYSSSPEMQENEIAHEWVGLYCDNGSSPILSSPQFLSGNNYFHGSNVEAGIWAMSNSHPILGMHNCSGDYYGNNSFVYSSFDGLAAADASSSIYAPQCYWGSSSPSSSWFTGSVTYIPYLTDLPQYSSQAPSPENNLYDTRMMLSSTIPSEETSEDLTRYYNDQWDLDKKIEFIRYLYMLGEAKGVADLCKDIITENPYAPEAFTALDMIYQISKNEKIKKDFDKNMFKTYLKTYEGSRSNQFLKADAMLLLAGLEKDVTLMDKVYKEHKETYVGKHALHQKFMYYFNETEDSLTTRAVLNEMDEVYPNEAVTYESHVLMGDEVMDPKEFYAQYFKKDAPESIQLVSTDINEILPEEYALNPAYPNPFNPSTTLEYALPTQSDVKCSIYNVSGNLVKEYSLSQNAGTYSIVWDGSNVSSGIYLIRFTAEAEDGSESFVDYQKVTLLK